MIKISQTHLFGDTLPKAPADFGQLYDQFNDLQSLVFHIQAHLQFARPGSALHSQYLELVGRVRKDISAVLFSILNDDEQGQLD